MTTTKAIIMVGGSSRGTRFRPLALDKAKIMFPIAGKPLLSHTVDAVLKVESIREIILIGFYDVSIFSEFISSFNARMRYSKRNCSIKYLKEFKALGTAGGLYHFREDILKGNPESFLVIHGDIVCSFPLNEMVQFYEEKKKTHQSKIDAILFGVKIPDYELFLALNGSDLTSFGTIVSEENGEVVHYVEKPESKISDVINGGIYLFNESLFRRLSNAKISKITIANDNTHFDFVDEDIISLEKDILHNLPDFGNTYVFQYRGFWKAIKTPSDALWANELYLDKISQGSKSPISPSSSVDVTNSDGSEPLKYRVATMDQHILEKPSSFIQCPVYIHPSATVNYENGTRIGKFVSIGENVTIGAGTRISNSIILENCEIGSNTIIMNSIVSMNCKIGNWCRVEGTGINLISINEMVKKNGVSKLQKLLNQDTFKIIGIKDSGNISILGSGTQVDDDRYVLNSFILPNKTIKHDVKYEIIM
ncbi:hypothetical protein CANARDRAFT_177620 [[Candida] arabinofermentans NRRL YB-2248]|uniref:mannose-1-phosphate guanylyltransferase n=1 Tax=[Candida] arabinofermentans NRRL YB-2248 TaxID=983967 RepID=A0A1E4SVH4_9ASCO|nr:hypothetical protein CANARDRAFT_177620 [[Candida] arabinofermentans NRRL YB-2248]